MHSLVFCPRQKGQASFDHKSLIAALKSSGLIGTAIPGSESDYFTGERFLELMVFMGCSPSISLEPDASGDDYSFISIRHHAKPGRIYHGSLTRPPSCSRCKSPLDIQSLETSLQQHSLPVCNSCQTELDWSEINWNKTIGQACDAILVHNVFPHEAIPADELINTINSASGISWRYFYI